MKIVYCIHSLCNSGGMERIITEKANALSELGHHVSVITADQMNRPVFFTLHPSVSFYDLEINYSENKGLLKKICHNHHKLKQHKEKLSKLLYELHPDITISTMGNEFLFLYKIKDGSKKLLEIHFGKGYRLMRNRKWLWKLIDLYRDKQETLLVSRYDKFVVLTQEDKLRWNKVDNIVVIPNFLTSYPSCRAYLENKVCLAVGRLSHQKGFDMLIKSWKLVYEQFPDWKLNIYGGGELYNSLNALIDSLGLREVVNIYPPTTQIENAYIESSMMLVTSRYEGLPLVILEAYSFGIPVVSFACQCGPRDLIRDGVDGFLVEDYDIETFAYKTMRLMENMSQRKKMGHAAYESSLDYSKEKIMSRWIGLFESMLEQNKRSNE